MERPPKIRCRWCDLPIYGAATTALGGGWIHQGTNRERCEGDDDTTAAPLRRGYHG